MRAPGPAYDQAIGALALTKPDASLLLSATAGQNLSLSQGFTRFELQLRLPASPTAPAVLWFNPSTPVRTRQYSNRLGDRYRVDADFQGPESSNSADNPLRSFVPVAVAPELCIM